MYFNDTILCGKNCKSFNIKILGVYPYIIYWIFIVWYLLENKIQWGKDRYFWNYKVIKENIKKTTQCHK